MDPSQLKADFEDYLDGFSSNVQDILENFEFRNQIPRLSKADALGTLIEKLVSPEINLGPSPVLNGDASEKHPGLDNHAMGTIFEELVRKFNEENNEEAGEHWTPRDAVKLMAKLIAKRKKLIQNGLARRDEAADPVVRKVNKKGKAKADPIRGLFPNPVGDKALVLEYEPDSDLRDTEQIPLLEDGGIEAFIRREVLPHAEDAWFDESSLKVGYEISFNRYFYKPQPLRSLNEIRSDILALEKETEGLLVEIVGGGS